MSWNLQVQKNVKVLNEVDEKLRTEAKKQENQVILSLLNQGEWTLLKTCKKYAIGDRYYKMSMKRREKFLRRFNEANVSVIDTTSSHIPPVNLSISVSEWDILYSPIKILDGMFKSVSNLLQDQASIVQCPESEGYLAKSKSDPNQPLHIKLNKNGRFAWDTSCTKFKSYRICSHTIAAAEKEKPLETSLGFVRPNQAKLSDLVDANVSKNTGKKRQKAMQRRKGTKQVKGNPAIYFSDSNTNKEFFVHSFDWTFKVNPNKAGLFEGR